MNFLKSWHSMEVTAEIRALPMDSDSEFEFITEHYYGFTKMKNRTSEYEVCHPKWNWYPVKDHQLHLNFQKMYGPGFACLDEQQPLSVMLAEGSPVEVKIKKYVA